MNLLSFPLELLFEILIYVDTADFQHLSTVNKDVINICNNDHLWKIKFNQLTGTNEQSDGNWLRRYQCIYQIIYPKTCYTLIKNTGRDISRFELILLSINIILKIRISFIPRLSKHIILE